MNGLLQKAKGMAKRKSSNDAQETTTQPKKPKRTKDDLIASINQLSPEEFERQYAYSAMTGFNTSGDTTGSCCLSLKSSALLSRPELDECLALIEQSSRKDYEGSTIGWHPRRKRREMLEAEMYYLLLRDGQNDTDHIQGFLSFMFTHDSTPSVPVVYVYEIHLAPSLRSKGLGSRLMQIVEAIARRAAVEKVMLTCFLSNTIAMDFYQRRGYGKDVCSPDDRETRTKIVKADYLIMSQELANS